MNIEFNPEKHIYLVDGIRYPSVTEIIAESDGYGTAADFFTREAAIRGNFIHRIVELDILDRIDTDSIDQALMPYYTAWKKFRQENMLTVESVEKPMASPVFMFAGTPDIVGTLNGEKTILDIKSGAPSPATGMQIAGYKVFWASRGFCTARSPYTYRRMGNINLSPIGNQRKRIRMLFSLSYTFIVGNKTTSY